MSKSNSHEHERAKYFFRASAADFRKIPGEPIVYWVSNAFLNIFETSENLGNKTKARQGLATGDNSIFARLWYEVSASSFSMQAKSCAETTKLKEKWFPYNKGGEFRRWYGNLQWLVNWKNDGEEIRNFKDEKGKLRSRPQNTDCYFQEGITWSDVTSGHLSVRALPPGCVYDISGHSAFPQAGVEKYSILAYLNTKFSKLTAKMLNPTLHFQIGDYQSFPYPDKFIRSDVEGISKKCVAIAQDDWNSYEASWGFGNLPLLHTIHREPTLKACYQKLRTHWREMTLEMQRLEEENNRIFIDAYGLQDELTPDVPLNEITLTCNPHYRYGGDKSEEELEAMLLADTMRELVSYAVGCMFGRYSLDKPGLILANQGETLADYLAKVPQPTFPADDDNVIPLLDGDWFPDDITLRFRQFLRVAFGDAHYEDNLAFIEQALNIKSKRNYSLRDYFLGEFYADHVRRYKKRPIYWLFSSPKGTFSALVYLHRYRPDTVSVVLSYLRDFRKKLASRLDYLQQVAINPSASQSEKTKAGKEADTIKKQLIELDDYERDTLYPLATEQVELDLDDGVKVNYLKLGAALKKIPGLDAKGED
ncbi:BREX-1 system adenine-specific DNA-methyltransferase PglX [Stutzerimonas nitrititolerans]|uniref:BREX-1 system adenine-specific DNA-methyltransferase PglX n=1 Tax=Stutzerimonas nitrititolerans TaxID=2482751 RepID=UPI00289EB37A|nr:BREX-1 system adenine-specific DNA-methyltransferase PglX [Stutzerimonas nitrititolerans]